ncbi:MAG: DUF5020 family protein [Bacteroidales bacterium]
MKKLISAFIVFFGIVSVKAQEVQLLYDFGEDHDYLTSTVQMFKPDKWGSTFFFIDMNYDTKNASTVSLAYWEIARGLKLGDSKFAAHVEYNGGLLQVNSTPANIAYSINSSWLGGLEYNMHNAGFTKGLTLMAMYKYIKDKNDISFQLTAVWYMHMLNKKLSFNGFADFWREDNTFYNNDGIAETKYVFLTQPQIWYNFTSNISLGSEIDFNYNFSGVDGFRVNPTVAAKWTF